MHGCSQTHALSQLLSCVVAANMSPSPLPDSVQGHGRGAAESVARVGKALLSRLAHPSAPSAKPHLPPHFLGPGLRGWTAAPPVPGSQDAAWYNVPLIWCPSRPCCLRRWPGGLQGGWQGRTGVAGAAGAPRLLSLPSLEPCPAQATLTREPQLGRGLFLRGWRRWLWRASHVQSAGLFGSGLLPGCDY